MSNFPKIKLSFSAKILIPVFVLLVLLPAVMLLIVHRSSVQQLEREARHQLRTADAVFQNSLALRSRQLLARYKHIVEDPTFAEAAQKKQAHSMTHDLATRLEKLDGDADILLFIAADGTTFSTAQRDPQRRLIEFEKGVSALAAKALAGHPGSAVLPVESSVFNAIAIPVLVDKKVEGALVVGSRVSLTTLRELTSLVGGDGVFVANSNIAASTLTKTDVHASLLPHWTSASAPGAGIVQPVVLDRIHYLALASPFPDASSDADLGYVLLLSYEDALQELRQTRAMLWVISAIGLFISTIVIWIVIGKVTAPLRELRSLTEAIGAGDFTRKVQVTSTDELGQLAYAFNHMTKNLRHSHDELQRTFQTLKATQAQLIQSEKLSAVGEFVSGVAHELNNPLTSVIGFAELLKEVDLHPKHHSYLQYIVKSTERCHKIVQGLLSFARQHPPERALLNVNDMIGDVLEILAYELRTSNIEVQREFSPSVPKILGDCHQFQQVVLNILNNARQALENISAKGVIRIATESNATHVRITIEDNGPGIPADHLTKVFDPFFTTKPTGKGTGLGLSLCYGIIREHNGAITANSLPGKGASFLIEIPIPTETDANSDDHRVSTSRFLKGDGKRVLVIDDEEWILELVRQILQQDGFQVDTVQNGDAALDQVERTKYELLVCDWRMPGLSGPQLYQRIAEKNPEAAGRLMFMTGDVVNDSFQQFLKQHTKRCLSKPFSVQELRHSIGAFLIERQPKRVLEHSHN
ncbi:MAG: hybrid sensor histidine kinase/response regulator [Limisphaerales bacterium]